MTTIACNKKQIACDLQITWQGGYKFRVKTKVFEIAPNKLIPEPFFVGYSGTVEEALMVIDWLRDPENVKRPKEKVCDFVVLTKSGKILTFRNPNPAAWIEVAEPFFAIGSGCNFAQATMLSGASPREAVLAASKLDAMTGMGVKSYEV